MNAQVIEIKSLMKAMWDDYVSFNPQAQKIYDLLLGHGEIVLNDHIALRTFKHPKLGLEALARPFTRLGYEAKGEYHFKEKKLFAIHYETPNPELPKVFISELLLDQVSPFVRETLEELITQMSEGLTRKAHFPYCGRPWTLSHKTYNKLAEESEYASWVAAHGFRPNHFTVNVNALKKFPELKDLNHFLKQNGFKLNSSGGEIKGGPSDYLEQSSTMAEATSVKFSDGEFEIPACYYEFAKRYRLSNGKFYQGFVAKSADKIFESTNR